MNLALRTAALILLVLMAPAARALDWITIAPNPAYTRDFSMAASTVALSYPPQSQSINPAGLTLFNRRTERRGVLILNPGGLWQLSNYHRFESEDRSGGEAVTDGLRLLTGGVALQIHILNVAALLSQPVMEPRETDRYLDYENHSALPEHQNSILFSFALHPRVSVGGRIDRYYRWDTPGGEGYSYGVILRPRGVRVGVQYQHYPGSGNRVWHPLDRRSNEGTTAGVAIEGEYLTVSFQVMNLTQSANVAFLEPHAGIQWRPARALALRAGGVVFSRTAEKEYSRSQRWAWTAGLGFLDANWLRQRENRSLVPDDILQLGVGVIYDRRAPIQGITSLTCAWRI